MRRLSPEDFEGVSLKLKAPTGVLFYAEWCPYCIEFKPSFEAVRLKGFELAFADISDEDNPLWDDFEIKVVPTLIAFKEGKTLWRKDGVLSQGLRTEDLEDMVAALRLRKKTKPDYQRR